ncbi:hypothetical protein PENTCL1PPCAC_1228, partial [Pristionchus entomophagus]
LIQYVFRCNTTCSGGFCYRAEYAVKYLGVTPNESAVTVDCFEYPFNDLKLGCRRNFEGIILCVCQTDLCNEHQSTGVEDLPVVENCLDGIRYEGLNDSDVVKPCHPSHYCSKMRGAM